MSFQNDFTRRCLLVVIQLALCPCARAAVSVSIDDVVVTAGSTAIVGVYASSSSGDIVSGFNLPFDINSDGYLDADGDNKSDLPSGFSLSDPAVREFLFANTAWDLPQPQIVFIGVDAIPTGSGADIALSSSRTKLFDLAVDVGSDVSPGTVIPLRIIVPNSPLQSLFNLAGPGFPTVSAPVPGQPVVGSITVVVPEPSTLLGFCGGTVLIGCVRRRVHGAGRRKTSRAQGEVTSL